MLNGVKCYVAGPYSGDPDANTEAAIAAGEKLMRLCRIHPPPVALLARPARTRIPRVA